MARDVVRAHPRHLVLFALVGGLLCGGWGPQWASLPALAAIALAGRAGVAVLAAAAALGGAVVGDARREAIDRGLLPAALGSTLASDVTVLEPMHRRTSGELVARVAVTRGAARGEQLFLRYRPPAAGLPIPAAPGDIVRVRGRLAALDDFDRLQRRRGALAVLEASSLRRTGRVRGGLLGAVDAVRRRAERALGRGLDEPRSALLAGMVLGQDERIGDDVRDAFQASGLAHLLAVSGTNVMLLATLVIWLGAGVGAPLRTRLLLSLALIAAYVPLTGAGPSIQRAGVMGAAGIVAALAGRRSSRWYALGLAAAVTLALNPYAAAEPGWQLSFAAVVGLLWLAAPLRETLERRRLPAPVAEVAAMTIAASVATAPLLATHFGRLSLVSLPANLVVAPVVAPVMWLGMLAAVVGQAGAALAAPLNALNDPLLAFVGATASVAAALPGATIELPEGGAGGAVAGYVVLIAGWLTVRALRKGRNGTEPRFQAPLPLTPWLRRPLGRAIAAVSVAALVVVLVAWPDGRAPALRRGELLVSFLDIGQGDATLVQRDGTSVLVDTGPPDGGVERRLREEGVRRLDALVLTHAQLDHEGAALPVVRDFRPRVVVDGGAGWTTAVQRELPRAAAAAGSGVLRAVAGDVLRVGPLTLRVLWPPAAIAGAPPEGDPNNRAIVTHLRSGAFDLLLAADAESDVTGGLRLPAVEALKVAHHGSDDPGLGAQLEQMRPLVAAIEVGRHNTYGHPTAATLAALRSVPHVVRTDRDGTVRLRVRGEDMTVERLGPQP